jgi:hypothetical protein
LSAPKGGTFGLVRAWYHVGALQIVMSLWNIDDDATKDLMLAFMRRLKSGVLTEFALRDAMLATRQKYVDPALWASVALFGLPSKALSPLEPTAPRIAPPTDPAMSVTPFVATVPSGPTQRAILYEEDPENPAGRKFSGSVVWGTALSASAERQEVALRGEIAIPERKLSVTWSLQPNKDAALPTSHVLELKFTGPADLHGGGIQNVPGILVKPSEEVRGTSLEALSVRLAGGVFLVGLSAANVQSNETLLKEGRWLDIPIVYDDGRRAILTIEKGRAGDRAFGEVFSAWSAIGAPAGAHKF